MSYAVVQHPIRLSLSLASTAALALASLPIGIRPLQAQEAPAPAAEPEAASTEAADLGGFSNGWGSPTARTAVQAMER